MPLPVNNTAWPPPDTGHTRAMAEWSAWYSGDPDQLQGFYAANQPYNAQSAAPRPSQYAGGVQGAFARWWWGTPSSPGEARTKLHVPLAADIAGTSADLLFAAPVKITSDSDTLMKAMDSLQDAGLDAQLHEAGEIASALGGVYLRTVWDKTISPLPWLDAVHPDGAVPEFKAGRLSAVTLWTVLTPLDTSRTTVYRLMERHEPGAIEYALYQGNAMNLGTRVPLLDHPEAEDYAELVNADGIQETGIQGLTVSYVPNMLPNRSARHSHQGRSDFQGVTPLFDALDEAYSSWWRDIRHAKARLHVPAQYLESLGPGQGAVIDTDREVYVPLQGVLARHDDGLLMQSEQFAIRYQEHSATCQDWANRAVQAAGYSASTFGEQDGTALTAAEVQQRQQRSYLTRDKKARYWGLGLRDALTNLVEVANANLSAGISPADIGIEFGKAAEDSPLSLAQTMMVLRNAEVTSTETRVRMLHPEWEDKAVAAEVAAIHHETAIAPPPPGLTTGGHGL